MNAHRDIDALVSAYADGELPPEEAARVEAHLASHPEARAALEDYRRLDRLARALAPPEAGEARWARVRAAVLAAAPPPPETADQAHRRWNRIFRLRAAAFAAGLAAAAACGLFMVLHGPEPVRPPEPPGPVEPPRQEIEIEIEPGSRYIPQVSTSPDGQVVGITWLALPGAEPGAGEEKPQPPEPEDAAEPHE